MGVDPADQGTQPVDTDGDGTFDFLDTDSDSDGIADSLEGIVDTDADGEFDFRDTDADGDSLADSLESTLDLDSDGEFDFRDVDDDQDPDTVVPNADVAALLEIGSPGGGNQGIGFIVFFGDTPPESNAFGELDIRPQLRFTHFDDCGHFDPEQQEVALDPTEYIHLTVTDRWELYEQFYGQGQNAEFIRYLDGLEEVLDKHIDLGQPDRVWVLSYNLEGAEYRNLDAKSLCDVEPSDYLLNDNSYHDRLSDDINSGTLFDSGNETSNSWYVDLVNKLRR